MPICCDAFLVEFWSPVVDSRKRGLLAGGRGEVLEEGREQTCRQRKEKGGKNEGKRRLVSGGGGGEGTAGKSPVVLGDGPDMRDARVRMYRMGTGTANLIKASHYSGQASIAYRSEQVSIDLLTKPVRRPLSRPPLPPACLPTKNTLHLHCLSRSNSVTTRDGIA